MNEIFSFILTTAVIVGIFMSGILMLVRAVFLSQIRKNSTKTSADINVYMLFHLRYSGNPNEVLYTWRKVMYELKDTQAPDDLIEAAHRMVKYYERKLTKATWLVTPKGLTHTITRGVL